MRKKSHISLARDIVRNSEDEGLRKHKWAFYLGSILPDIKPSFLYKKHEIDGTFEQVKKEVRELSDSHGKYREHATKYYRDLGQITHYIADYFTFPHNTVFDGNLKDHCLYERDMKHAMRAYIHTGDARNIFQAQRMRKGQITDIAQLFDYIEKTHQTYLGAVHNVADDCRWIVEMCSWALIGLVNIICKADERLRPLAWQCA